MSFFSELKRRNVFKVALAYIVAAWLVLQITDVLMSVLGLPETAGKFVFLLLVIAFVPILAFAWAYEVTPEGIKRESEVDRSESITRETAVRLNRITIGLLIAVAAMVALDRFLPAEPAGESPSVADVSAETSPVPAEAVETAAPEADAEPADTTPSVAVPLIAKSTVTAGVSLVVFVRVNVYTRLVAPSSVTLVGATATLTLPVSSLVIVPVADDGVPTV